ncbi:MAG: uracil-DNA glycosylase [Alphaproteobacteria bacterium]|nr:uracil-DNA glycosylase [Alphaproteobacteria bacterium]
MKLIRDLQAYQGENVFNPWRDYNDRLDISKDAPIIRTENLKKYLAMRQEAPYILIAEGLSYQGGHFSGIAMTSERQLVNDHEELIFKGLKQRTSHPNATEKKTIQEKGFTENTGSIVWSCLTPLMPTDRWITWNIFPWHPHKAGNFLTNRAPTEEEQEAGLVLLKQNEKILLENRKVIAVGRISSQTLERAGIRHIAVRHPANGGAPLFRSQIEQYIKL